MDFFPWKDEYSVGLFEIDSQHRQLVAILNRIHVEMKEDSILEHFGELLDELIQYTMLHFSTEEALMERYGYPEVERHRAVHAELTREVMDYRAAFHGNQVVILSEVATFLKKWLAHHILRQDKDYAMFILKKTA